MRPDQPASDLAYTAPTAAQIAVAVEAARRWIEGAATGGWGPFVDLLAVDVRFTVPLTGFLPGGVGKGEARRFFAFLTENLRNTLTVKNMLANGDQIAFEFRAEGTIQGLPNANHLFLALTVEEDVVVSFREYLAWPGGLRDVTGGRDLLD